MDVPDPNHAIQSGRSQSLPQPAPSNWNDDESHAPRSVPLVNVDNSPLWDRPLYEGGRWLIGHAIFFALLAAAFLGGLGLTWSAVAVVGPLAVAFAFVYGYGLFRPAFVRLSREGVFSSRHRLVIPFHDIVDVIPGPVDKRGRFLIHIVSSFGPMTLPARLDCDSRELLALLHSCIQPRSGSPEPPPGFEAFLKQQLILHPVQDVHVFRGVAKPMRPDASRPYRLFAYTLLLPVPLWIGLAIAFPRLELFVIVSVIFGLVGSFVFLLSFAGRTRTIRNPERAVLIVSPSGLALNQADLRGELTWREVQRVSRTISGASFTFVSQPAGLYLKVAGADIGILDIYDRPLETIIPLVEHYAADKGKARRE